MNEKLFTGKSLVTDYKILALASISHTGYIKTLSVTKNIIQNTKVLKNVVTKPTNHKQTTHRPNTFDNNLGFKKTGADWIRA